ncbi:efflux RND transporter periplasmic adaptor subunit (plasmid) [Dyella sp. BiH032]|uniref:efflux RND transporter periplasmic adaptor subunit n=1 Tax=Dyella sp. BiH032 TaxID=3075430 RepID=UPI0028938098|nr:efflux RND transporter periplasmic adaptor subunit [Dyella sp. BiH032]WNL48506.1 efflux RND transporter periplasmic adaptor subunit [Dyella sp. BiH032]
MKRAPLIAFTLAALLMTAIVAYWAGRHGSGQAAISGDHPASTASPAPATSAKPLYWYDPMIPAEHHDKPGLSSMGMTMIPKYADAGADQSAVRIDSATVQNLGVRTASVERRALTATVRVPGTINWDLRQAVVVSARVDAVVSKLYVRAPYTNIPAGAPLAELLAPQWSSAVAESQALQHVQSDEAKALRGAAQQRLQVLGLSPADSHAMGSGGQVTLHAPQAGVISTLDVREGQRVNAGQTLMTINGLSTIWVEAALPQAVAGTVHADTPVTVRVDAVPGKVFRGQVEAVLPDVDMTTRTQRARIVLANPDGALSPGMFATVQLEPTPGKAVPVVPDDALISTGEHTRLIVAEDGGRFRAVAVRTGRAADGYTEILGGLSGGEKVVVSGQFLIDSEASLSGALDRLNDPATTPAPAATAAMPGMPMQGDHP